MPSLSAAAIRAFLSQSIASLNQNKLRGTLAELALRDYLSNLGFQDRVSPGGWIARGTGRGILPRSTAALFPETVIPNQQYPTDRELPNPAHGLHTICSTFHQSGISGFYCAARIQHVDEPSSLQWHAIQLGLPVQQEYQPLIQAVAPLNFTVRPRRYNFLRYHTDTTTIADAAIPEEFSKEHLRVAFSSHYLTEIFDIDGIFWGQQHTYPIVIEEKTPVPSRDLGPFLELDVGPFVKLAVYAAKRGNLHHLYVVREIDNEQDRNLMDWRFITFDHLAQFASRARPAAEPGLSGSRSSLIRVPKSEFQPLNAATLAAL